MLTERYNQVRVNEQRAASAYTVTQARLRHAERQQAASRDKVAALAAEEFESGGGFDPVTAMIGDAHGPQAYLRQVGMGQVLAQWGTETLAANQANNAVAAVFRTQAHKLLVAQQADLRAANDLKVAIASAVNRQQTLVRLTKGKRDKLASQLAAAQAGRIVAEGGPAGRPGRAGRRGRRAGHRRGRECPVRHPGIVLVGSRPAPRRPRVTSRPTGR